MQQLDKLPAGLASAVRQEVRGERIQWLGQPKPSAAFRSATPVWLMGVPWSALTFTIFGALVLAVFFGKAPVRVIPQWEYAAMGAALIFTGAFALVGLGMLLAPIWAWWKARHTVHVITDKRLATLTTGRSTRIRSVLPHQLLRFERKERADHSGSLRIVTGYAKDSDGDRTEFSEDLVGIPDVSKVEQLLRRMQVRAENRG